MTEENNTAEVPEEDETLSPEAKAQIAYLTFLSTIDPPPALDKTRHGRYINLKHLQQYLRPKMLEHDLMYRYGRNDTVNHVLAEGQLIEAKICRTVTCTIVHIPTLTEVETGRTILYEPGVLAKEDHKAGLDPVPNNDTIESAETRARRRMLGLLTGVVTDQAGPDEEDEYEKHERDQVIVNAQLDMLNTIEDAEALEVFYNDIAASKALKREHKEKIYTAIKEVAAMRGWKSDD